MRSCSLVFILKSGLPTGSIQVGYVGVISRYRSGMSLAYTSGGIRIVLFAVQDKDFSLSHLVQPCYQIRKPWECQVEGTLERVQFNFPLKRELLLALDHISSVLKIPNARSSTAFSGWAVPMFVYLCWYYSTFVLLTLIFLSFSHSLHTFSSVDANAVVLLG